MYVINPFTPVAGEDVVEEREGNWLGEGPAGIAGFDPLCITSMPQIPNVVDKFCCGCRRKGDVHIGPWKAEGA